LRAGEIVGRTKKTVKHIYAFFRKISAFFRKYRIFMQIGRGRGKKAGDGERHDRPGLPGIAHVQGNEDLRKTVKCGAMDKGWSIIHG
jgi:hypothetical protein